MCVRKRVQLIFSIFAIAATAIAAQQTMPQTASTDSIDLQVVVTPNSGPPVAGLQQSDFTIRDNGTTQPITSFHPVGAQDPVHVILVIDEVNVSYENIAYQRGQIEKFLRANGGELVRPTQFAFFTDRGMQIQDGYSTDGNELSTSLNQHAVALRDIRRSSQFQASDRLNLSVTAIRALTAHEAELPGRKIVLWISPGWPLLSGPGIELDTKQQNEIFATLVDLTNRLRQAHITLYDVNPIGAGEGVLRANYYQNFLKGVSKPGQVALGNLSLQVLAAQSGGLNLYGSNDLTRFLEQCMADVRASYSLTFKASHAERHEEYHHLEINVNKPGLTARTTQGYYAQP